MRRVLGAALAGLVLAGCAGAVAQPGVATPVPAAGPRAERPTYSLGDRWIRSDGIWELIRVEPDLYVFAAAKDEEIHLSKDLALVRYRTDARTVLEFTPTPRLDWPLAVGKKGAITGKFQGWYRDPYDAELQWSVEAYEDIAVPAGTYKAFRIAYIVTPRLASNFASQSWWARTQGPDTWKFRFWYAPDVRRLVKAESAWWINFDLVAVDPAESEPLRITLREPNEQAHLTPETEFLLIGARAPLLTGTITGGKGVATLAVALNGEVVLSERTKGEPKKTVLLNVELPLRDGKNVVLVTAADPAGLTSQEARTVFYAAPLALAWPRPGPPTRVGREFVTLTVPVPAALGGAATSVALNDVRVDTVRAHSERDQFLTVRLRLSEGENVVRVRYGAFLPDERIEERRLVFDPALAHTQATALPVPAGSVAEKPTPAPAIPPMVVQQPSPLSADTNRLKPPPLAPSAAPMAPPPVGELPLVSEGPNPTPPTPEAPKATPTTAALPLSPPTTAEPIRASPPPIVATLPPLSVTLSSPPDQARVEHEMIGLAGLVAGGKGVGRVAVTLNGLEISRQEERAPERAVALNLPIRLREGQNTLVVTATEADGTISQEVRTIYYEKFVPLSVVFRYPNDAARMTDAVTVAAAVVTSSRGVAKVKVSLNGVEVHEQIERSPQKSVLVTAPLTLRDGVNTIGIIASEGDGTVRQEVRTVIYEAPKVTAAPPPSPLPVITHERWAVVIGIGNYENRHVPRLQYAVADAEAIYQTLIEVAGFKKEHVLLLTDTTERKPTLRNIRWALGTFLSRSARKDDTVLIFFAGHGAPELDPRGSERDGLAKYLIPGDADPEDLYSSALPMDELQTIFGRIEAERVVAFLDTCYSGAAGGRTFVSQRVRTRDVALDGQFLDRLTRSKGRAIITASRPAEVSIELKELGHGIFTYYLVQGLRGAADLNRDGIVTIQELYEYLEQQVTQRARTVGGNQHPVMKGELEGVLPLVKIGGR